MPFRLWLGGWAIELASQSGTKWRSVPSSHLLSRWGANFFQIREARAVFLWIKALYRRKRLNWFHWLFSSLDKVEMINSCIFRMPQNGTCSYVFYLTIRKRIRNLFYTWCIQRTWRCACAGLFYEIMSTVIKYFVSVLFIFSSPS